MLGPVLKIIKINGSSIKMTRLVKTSFKDCTWWLRFIKNFKKVFFRVFNRDKNWCAIQANLGMALKKTKLKFKIFKFLKNK
jgi:hypothetical protein